jgi:hypothetical protein
MFSTLKGPIIAAFLNRRRGLILLLRASLFLHNNHLIVGCNREFGGPAGRDFRIRVILLSVVPLATGTGGYLAIFDNYRLTRKNASFDLDNKILPNPLGERIIAVIETSPLLGMNLSISKAEGKL